MAVTYQDLYDLYGQELVDNLAYDKSYKLLTSGTLIKGTSYTILDVSGSASFTAVGASANTVGLTFVCTSSYITPTWGTGILQTGVDPIAIINFQLDSVREKLAAIAIHCGQTVDETNTAQAQFIIHYTMYRLFLRNQRSGQGEDEKREAIDILAEIWGKGVLDYFDIPVNIEKAQGRPTAVMSKPSRIVRHNYHADLDYCSHDPNEYHNLNNTYTHGTV